MPYPKIPDVRLYAVGGPAPTAKIDEDATFASLFSAPHPSLGGRMYVQALADELRRGGAFDGSPSPFQVISRGPALGLPEQRVEKTIWPVPLDAWARAWSA